MKYKCLIPIIIEHLFLGVVLPTPDFIGHANTILACSLRRISGIGFFLIGIVLLAFVVLANKKEEEK